MAERQVFSYVGLGYAPIRAYPRPLVDKKQTTHSLLPDVGYSINQEDGYWVTQATPQDHR